MKISSKGRYALRFMIDLAQNDTGECISLKDISERQDISIKYLEQIVTVLGKDGLISSVRGNKGGYKMVKKADKYTVGEILRAVEGNLSPVACLDNEPNQCSRYSICPSIDFWKGLYKVINEYVDSVTLQDLVDKADINGFNYTI